MDKQMTRDIISAFGPSGRERRAGEVIRKYVAPYCDETYFDTLGNLIAIKRGSSGKKIMLSAHMDQIGLMVTDIDENGFLYVTRVGGVSALLSVAREVVFGSGLRGVTYYGSKNKRLAEITMQDLYVDIGATSRDDAEKLVSIGDIAVFESNIVELSDKISSRTLDDRIACAIIAQAMRDMQSIHSIYAVFTVQEEVGCRGAMTAAFAIDPDLNISIDVTDTGDTPECERMSVRLGNGPTVKAMDGNLIAPVSVRDFMTDMARNHAIPIQNEVLRFGGTDAGAVQLVRTGIMSGCVSIPCRYIHTPVETVDVNDVNYAIRLILACCKEEHLPICRDEL